MIGLLAKIIRTSNLIKNVLRSYGKVWRKSNFCILWFYWLIYFYIFNPLPRNASFLILKHSCVREELSDVVFFFQCNFNKPLCKNIFLVSFHLHNSCAPPQLIIFPSTNICAVEDIQRLRFGISKSPDKFTGKPKIVSHPKISQ